MEDLDSALFPLPGLVDYRACFDGTLHLDIRLTPDGSAGDVLHAAQKQFPNCTVQLHSQPARLTDSPLYLGKRHLENR